MPGGITFGYWHVVVEGSRDGQDDQNVGVTWIMPCRNRLTTRWETPDRIGALPQALEQEGLAFVFGPRWWKNHDGSWSASVKFVGPAAAH
jgi:hypothetical protein